MVRLIRLFYNINETSLKESVFTTISPTPGKIYLYELKGYDEDGKTYRIYVRQDAIIPNNEKVVNQASTYSIYDESDPTTVLVSTTFIIPTYVDTGDFLLGTYTSQNGSKITIDSFPTRKMILKSCN